MAGLSDKVELDREDIRRLDQLGDRLGDTRPLMAAIGGFVRDVARGRFREQKGPDGKPTTLATMAEATMTKAKSAAMATLGRVA